MQWHIALRYDHGSELVQADGSGRQDFVIEDTWLGTHSTGDANIEGDNANGDYDDQIQMLGDITGDPIDSCVFASPIPGASISCIQA